MIQFDKVDLPQPDGPSNNTFSPLLIIRLIFFNVGSVCDLYRKLKSLNSIIGSYSFVKFVALAFLAANALRIGIPAITNTAVFETPPAKLCTNVIVNSD